MPKYLLLKHYRSGPEPHHPFAPRRYEDSYRLCYVRGPEGIIVELAERIG